jgi:microcystin-dependent protein
MEGTIAEIRYFGGNFAPRNWAFCQGQLLAIAQNTALFSLLGTNYGGNGQTTFGLPDLRSRLAVGNGQGPGLSSYTLGEMVGAENYTIGQVNMAPHTHPITGTAVMKSNAVATGGGADAPQNTYPAILPGTDMYATANNGSFLAAMQSSFTTGNTGSSQPVHNLQPTLALNPIICLFGVYPSRN